MFTSRTPSKAFDIAASSSNRIQSTLGWHTSTCITRSSMMEFSSIQEQNAAWSYGTAAAVREDAADEFGFRIGPRPGQTQTPNKLGRGGGRRVSEHDEIFKVDTIHWENTHGII